MAIDSYYKTGKVVINDDDMLELKKIFNREYTKGFLNYASNNEIINDYRPNHMGVNIGKIVNYRNNMADILLTGDVTIGSGLRVIDNNGDVGIQVNDFYIGNKLVKEGRAGDVIRIKVNSPVKVGDKVLITLDSKLNKRIDEEIRSNLRKVEITGKLIAKIDNKLSLMISDGINEITVMGNIVDKAKKSPVTMEDIVSKLNRLGDTVYTFSNLDIDITDFV